MPTMKRITFDGLFCDIAKCEDTPGGSYCENGTCSQRQVWERLKAIEDTLGDEYDLDHLRDLLQAEKDGRLFVPPCKPGDTVWYITTFLEICEAEVTNIELNVYTRPQMWMTIKYRSKVVGEHEYKSRIDLMLDKTVFLSRAEAEAALAQTEAHNE